MSVDRRTVDLSAWPDLVVIYLGMRVNAWWGLKTVFGFGGRVDAAVGAKPDGLLLHENVFYSFMPMHAGFRQYWRDYESLERWARSDPHRLWWQTFLRDSGGTGFWHEAYLMRGGMEAIFDDMPRPIGMLKFAPIKPARGPMFSSRARVGREPAPGAAAPGVSESELYGGEVRDR